MTDITDAMRLDFLEGATRKSLTGVWFDWIPSVEGERSGFRFMTRHNVCEPRANIRAAIDAAISQDKRGT